MPSGSIISAQCKIEQDIALEKGELNETIAASVSSPGAERAIRVPQDLERFEELPMSVVFKSTDSTGNETTNSMILRLVELDIQTNM